MDFSTCDFSTCVSLEVYAMGEDKFAVVLSKPQPDILVNSVPGERAARCERAGPGHGADSAGMQHS